MKITILCISYNSFHVLQKFFNGLKMAGYFFEFILIDNGSRNQQTLEKITTQNLKDNKWVVNARVILNPKNLMYTKAVNQGLKATVNELILIMNPDCWGGEEGWLNLMVDYWKKYQPDIAGYKLVRENGTIEHVGARLPGVHLGKGEEDKGQYDNVRELMEENQYVTGACLMLSRKTLDKYGYLDEQYIHYRSDSEYCVQNRKKGAKIWYFPVKMIHLFGGSSI